MMFKNRLWILFSIALILLMILPSAFGAENDTVSLDSSPDAQTLSSDIYFDSNATNDHGEGTLDNPYRELRDGRILDDSIIHLKNGEYGFSQINSHNNISIIGQDVSKTIINGNGGALLVNNRLVLENVTICNLNILNQGDLIASNTIFANSSAIGTGFYGRRCGGAFNCVDINHNAYLTNCTFINNRAGCGGAIYLNGGILEIEDCVFINNTALYYGGAVACEYKYSSGMRLTVKRSEFISDMSVNDAGGAVYIKSGEFIADDLNISNCNGSFGGAMAILKSYAELNDVNAFNNHAKYDGGVIYQIYGNLTLKNSNLFNNYANNGGGLFAVKSHSLSVNNVSFVNNSANLLAGAFYSLLNDNFNVTGLKYLNNTASEFNDLLKQDNMSIIFSQDNYTLYNHIVDDSPLPAYYSSVDEGYVTSVKNQQNAGNCWAFAILATLESAVLKASGNSDLSEENMKNLAAIYSVYGWLMNTNEGGYDDMGFSYLTSWLGPVLESDDGYTDFSVLSPVLNSLFHVQNILFLKRDSYTDLDSIKKAIRDYGGVYTPIYMIAHYDYATNKYVQCYKGNSPCDHAVVLVGWDDNIRISGYNGAWIAKNSWGSGWGNYGYFYVSYYDDSCLKIGENDGGCAFIFNDTIKYDKNYQYDIAKTDYFFNTTKSVWYKNVFTSTGNEYLAAVSTYFEKNTHWDLSVKINGNLKLTKSGDAHAGYSTLELGQLIPLSIGDVFEIIFKITVEGDAGVPISENVSLNNRFYHENISYISYDGINWKDLFNLTWEYPEHIYNSQVACIKAFTVSNPINTTIFLTYENKTSDKITIVAEIFNQWGYPVNSGNVKFSVGGKTYNLAVANGVAKKEIDLKSANITVEFSEVGYESSEAHAELQNPLITTNMTLNITGQHNPVNITAKIVDEYGKPAMSGNVIFDIAGQRYCVNVVNGTAKLENIIFSSLECTVHAQYDDLFYYSSSNADESVELSLINTKISLDITSNEFNNPISIVAHVLDSNDNPVKYGTLVLYMSQELVELNVVNGIASINHTFSQTGNNMVYATFYDNEIYNSSVFSENLYVSKMRVNLTFDIAVDECDAYLAVGIKDSARGFNISIKVNGTDYFYSSTDSYVMCELKNLKKGSYNYTIKLISPIYESDDLEGTFDIVHQKTQIILPVTGVYYNGDYTVILKDEQGNIIPDREVYLTINGQTIKKRTNSQGIAIFKIAAPLGPQDVKVNFIGDDDYIKSSKSSIVVISSTIDVASTTYSYNSGYSATMRDSNGNLLVNKSVNVVLNGVAYNVTTDGKGRFSLNIKLNPGTYSVKITNPDTGEVKSQTINVVKRITQNKGLTMYYGAGKLYKVRVCDDNGNFVKGLKVTFKVNGRSYYAFTDKSGYASYKINLKPGTYTITAEYNGFKVSNKVKVKSTIITKNIKVKKGKIIKFTAKLVNKKGKILKNKKIIFKFKGKTYKVKTNRKGKAVLKITKKYKKGKYTITSRYGKLTIKNKIRII